MGGAWPSQSASPVHDIPAKHEATKNDAGVAVRHGGNSE